MSDQLVRADSGYEATPAWFGEPAFGLVRSDIVWRLARGCCDAAMLALAAVLTGVAVDARLGALWTTVLIVGLLVGFAASGAYLPRLRLDLPGELRRVLTASAVVTTAIGALLLVADARTGVGDAMAVYWFVAMAFVCTDRLALFTAQRALRSRSQRLPTLIVGAGRVGHLTAKRLIDDPQLLLEPIGFLDKEPLADDAAEALIGMPPLPVLGASWDLEKVVYAHGVEHVVVAFSTAPHEVLLSIVRRCWALGVTVSLVPRLYEVGGSRMSVEHLGALPLVSVRTSDPDGALFGIKYALDRLLAAISLLLLLPVLATVALAVLVTMGRPVLFRQRRVGRDGRVFWMYKFRTMRGAPGEAGEADAHWASLVLGGGAGDAASASWDDRRTPLGALLRRLSLDELPQLWNVLVGEMSFVGPRPERVHYVEQFKDVVYRYPDRHRVKSGLTGWAQVNGFRGATSLADRIEWDNFYIENWSPWLDLKILAMTLPALFGRGGGG